MSVTLCISFEYRPISEAVPTAFCYSDSLITTIGPISKNQQVEKANFLPSNQEIKHQTPYGIKIYNISAFTNEENQRRDFIFSIAGNVALGLQSLVHLDSVFRSFYTNYSFEEYLKRAIKTLKEFWKEARDKDIEYLMTATDDNNKVRIFYIRGSSLCINFIEIELQNELLIAVIGDHAEYYKDYIFKETNALMYADIEKYSALEIACVRTINLAVGDPEKIFIGGYIQASFLKGKLASYATFDNGEYYTYRGVRYEKEYDSSMYRAPDPILSYRDIYNPKLSIQEVVEILNQS